MAWINETSNLIKISDAKRRGFDVWELWLSNWGNNGAGADGNSLFFPTSATNPGVSLGGVYAVAIAPQSTVDRALITWASGNQLNSAISDQQDYYATPVSVKEPITWLVPGGATPLTPFSPVELITVSTLPFGGSGSQLYSNFSSTVTFGDTYLPAGNATPQTWGAGLGVNIWTQPQLRLLLWLKPPTTGLPVARAPLDFRFTMNPVSSATETLFRVVPLQGRRKVSVRIRNIAASGPVNIRLGSVVNENAFNQGIEATLATAAGVTATTPFYATINDQEIGFLTVYASLPGGGAPNGNLIGIVLAED